MLFNNCRHFKEKFTVKKKQSFRRLNKFVLSHVPNKMEKEVFNLIQRDIIPRHTTCVPISQIVETAVCLGIKFSSRKFASKDSLRNNLRSFLKEQFIFKNFINVFLNNSCHPNCYKRPVL